MKFAVVALIGVAAAEKQACIKNVKIFQDSACMQEADMTAEVKKAQWSMLAGFKTVCIDGEMSAMPTNQLDKCQSLPNGQSAMYFSETQLGDDAKKDDAKKDDAKKPATDAKKDDAKKAGAKFMAAGAAAV